MLRVTADTNIYISSLNFAGPPKRVLDLARDGRIDLNISSEILVEMARVLRDKFGWSDDRTLMALQEVERFTDRVMPNQSLNVVKEDPTDNRIIECAVAGGSDYLVTGDKHLLKLGEYKGVKIVTPADFVEIAAKQGRGR